MTLSDRLLEKLVNTLPPGAAQATVCHEDAESGVTARLDVARLDTLSGEYNGIQVRRAAPVSLAAWAKGVAERAAGLLEPLAVIEVDSPRGQALLRSKKPAERKDELHYYEVLLGASGDAGIRRYAAQRGDGQRRAIPFTLTHDALGQLVETVAH